MGVDISGVEGWWGYLVEMGVHVWTAHHTGHTPERTHHHGAALVLAVCCGVV